MLLINGNFYANSRGTDEWFQDAHILDVSNVPYWTKAKSEGQHPPQSHLAAVFANNVLFCFGGEKARVRFRTLSIATLK
jgi:hypothetical protein